ncbi:MAG: Nitrite reductase [Parcubacteria group bacterium GW2011_GWA2_40_8]|nr:MAG: Nitrite reductase [Parcubacteria group bacterium GW2011_GWB1_40_14]KKR78749.1 MAG: Nitrite reductase [Parcubacteria group bacterium GW2011_GWA2_40_8]
MEDIKPSTNITAIKVNKIWIFGVIIIAILIWAGFLYKKTADRETILPVKSVDVADISTSASSLPVPIIVDRSKDENKTVSVNLRATQVVSTLADGTTYEYWTYNNQVPGPFIRVMEGDMVEISLTHEHAHNGDQHSLNESDDLLTVSGFMPTVSANGNDGHMMGAEEMEHMEAGHGEHSIDLHAVIGPGGGAGLTRVAPNETKTFQFKATRPGIYVYHCASPHIPSHIANGMYGLILVEPKGGLPAVNKEFYVVQGEVYTNGKVGEKGYQELDKDKLLSERPEYVVFNGRVGALTGEGALHANIGDKVRIFFGVSGQLASNFHIIGEIFDKVYPEGDIVSTPHVNVQTTLVPGGGATMVEFTAEVPGKYLLVDHALTRAIDRGALGEFIVDGPNVPGIIESIQ